MKKKTFAIDDLYAEAWNVALVEVAKVVDGECLNVGRILGNPQCWDRLENIAMKLGVRFNENGYIVREA